MSDFEDNHGGKTHGHRDLLFHLVRGGLDQSVLLNLVGVVKRLAVGGA